MHFLFHIESSLFVQEMPMNYSIIWLILLLVKANLFVVFRLYCIYLVTVFQLHMVPGLSNGSYFSMLVNKEILEKIRSDILRTQNKGWSLLRGCH